MSPVLRCRFHPPRRARGAVGAKKQPVTRASRMLALAHHIEHEIERGAISDYAAAARALGLTRARLTQVMKLLLLAPGIQARILTGSLPATERSLRRPVAEPDWARQVPQARGVEDA